MQCVDFSWGVGEVVKETRRLQIDMILIPRHHFGACRRLLLAIAAKHAHISTVQYLHILPELNGTSQANSVAAKIYIQN